MTLYEVKRWLTFPLMTTHLWLVRKKLNELVKAHPSGKPVVLDIGGRKSPYTIGLPCEVFVSDIPRESDVQKGLNLGINDTIIQYYRQNRSNIKDIVYDNMSHTKLPDASYDLISCIEVIEHVPEDEDFIRNSSKVLKPGGVAFFTTPNGDYIKNEPPNYNPDHVKHFTREQLKNLLEKYYDEVDVYYAVKTGKNYFNSLYTWNISNPIRLIKTINASLASHRESGERRPEAARSAHLFAIARKKKA